jgi:hypothetical protein
MKKVNELLSNQHNDPTEFTEKKEWIPPILQTFNAEEVETGPSLAPSESAFVAHS